MQDVFVIWVDFIYLKGLHSWLNQTIVIVVFLADPGILVFMSLRAQSNFLSEAKFLQGDITDRCLCSLLLKTLETGVCCSLTTWMIRKFLNHFNLCFEHHPYLKDTGLSYFLDFVLGMVSPFDLVVFSTLLIIWKHFLPFLFVSSSM